MKIVRRRAAERLDRLLRSFPVVLILGPRQCGKTTLARSSRPGWALLDLERTADASLLEADVDGFLRANPRNVIFDEAQRLPGIFPALRAFVDEAKGKGRFILTGSASPSLVRDVSESLAGRVGVMEMTPFRSVELEGRPAAARSRWFWGGYPPVHGRRGVAERLDWLDSYVTTFLERDLPALGIRLPAARMRTLWSMLTHVHGNLLNASDLARSLGVSYHTVNANLDVLEQAFMIRRLPPFFANVQKRLTKSPKIYIRDSGVLHFLAGLRRPSELDTWSRRGASFEGMVVEELIALATDRTVRPDVFFWRTQAGAEVDLVIRSGSRTVPIEIKIGHTADPRSLAALRQCMSDLDLDRGFVVYGGSEVRKAGRGIELVPWDLVATGKADLGF